MRDLFYFVFHITSQLAYAHYLWNHICFSMNFQMLTDALCAEQFDALEAHMAYNLRRVRIAVIAGDWGGTFTNGGSTR